MPFEELFAEAERQLNICNSCRYCAGYCPVWPALELRTELGRADITHLANLCHDCQDCFTACMYTPPHEFGVNPPAVFSSVREDTYRRYVWPQHSPAWLRGRVGLGVAFAAVAALLVLLSFATGRGEVFAGPTRGSAYELVSHTLMVVVVAVPALVSVLTLARAAWLYWRDIHGPLAPLLDLPSWRSTLRQVATLRHQTGGAEGCSYPEGEPSAVRRRFHHLVMYGFLLTFISTTSAAILEQFFDAQPPYPYLSVPVLTGLVGGVAATAGCSGLIVLKRRSDHLQSTEGMRRADYAMLWALLLLMLTGLVVLFGRSTIIFAPALVVHLAAVVVAFAVAPYTKFVHWIYRLLSVHKDNVERGNR
ncbi:MAG TPA: tricarballylate utilization 4Fe-4S protein TcuB [Segeticoccus sp.]|uniref:tricarballylate utilization 4Fe-4S protein TcuB n=1 Tax=Segeticoccus sp. TaxID=2706531 RepID=UPI002D80B537|nr:tricarballylate utilization 4Fe-4S protein TcuB [Segeticoccus sp.]HET8600415.1 tricarballylate utilization 4Fe-4S protein TcuB [Segeticoccus sp.]